MKKRNETIVREVLDGEGISVVARKYSITRERARQILHRYCKRANAELYAAGTIPHPVYWRTTPTLGFLRDNKASL